MGLKDKVKSQQIAKPAAQSSIKNVLNEEEASFVIAKLRQASYQGVEFELFYGVMTKLTNIVEK